MVGWRLIAGTEQPEFSVRYTGPRLLVWFLDVVLLLAIRLNHVALSVS
jgi:hypothetical protein